MDKLNPDVVVVGMPSCGKTVFFTVLGKKFTNLVDGKRGAPLGFRLGTCDRNTASVVNVAYDRLRHRQWPEATKAGQIMPLRWEVFTGRRRIFELFSMDIAGETFQKTFNIQDGDNEHGADAQPRISSSKTQKISDVGDELYRPASDDSSNVGNLETDEEKAAGLLKKAIETAKVVCFMVNIALPDGGSGRGADDTDEKKLLRFRSSVMNMYLSLKENPKLRAKSMIVLTQAHRHQGEIERAGGPIMYLGDVCGGEAAELSNLAKENDIPVIAVSAVNEVERGANELPEIATPDDIPSSGLFGFLLAVSGMVARGDRLVGVRDAYLAYQRERVEYLKCPSQMLKARLAQARKCQAASEAFVKACNGYLDDRNNLETKDGSAPLSPSAIAMYKWCTKEDPDVKVASDKEYLVRDELWDRALCRAAATNGQTTVESIYNEVREGLEKAFPDKRGNDANEEFVYGFGEEDLFPGSEASTFGKWVDINLKEYRAELRDAIEELDQLKGAAIKIIDTLATRIGGEKFTTCLERVKKAHDSFSEKMSEFRSAWSKGANLTFPKVSNMAEEVAEKFKQVSEYKDRHERLEKERQIQEANERERIRRENEERQARIEAAHRRRARLTMLLFVCVLGVSALFTIRYCHDQKNKNILNEIRMAISHSDYDTAKRLYASLYSIKWLGISHTNYLNSNFPQRLALAADCYATGESARRLKAKHKSLCEWLDGAASSNKIVSLSEKISEVQRQCDVVVSSCSNLPPATTFDDIAQQRVDINARILAVKKCESLLKESIGVIAKFRDDWDEYQREAAYERELKDAESQLNETRSRIANFSMDSISNHIDEVTSRIGALEVLAGTNEDRLKKTEEFKDKVDAVVKKLEARYVARRKETFDKMLGNIQSAMASNSVRQVWDKYDAAYEFASSNEERGKLEGKYEDVLGFTVNAYEHALSEVEKTANTLRAETAISDKMIEGTRKSLKLIEMVRAGLSRRIPETRDDFNRIESHAKNVQAMLPVIVQIDGIRQDGNKPLNINSALLAVTSWEGGGGIGTGTTVERIFNGISPETQAQCVYLLIRQNELPSGSSRLVRVVDVTTGKTFGMSIRLSDLVPGINRVNLKGQLISRKENY